MVAQIGARRRYAVARGLTHAGGLHLLVTDACGTVPPWRTLARIPARLRPRALRAVLDRSVEDVPADRIRGSLSFFLGSRVGTARRRSPEPKVDFWVRQNELFGRHVAGLDWGNVDAVYAFNGAALEIFQAARDRGVRCILDQTAAPWRFNTDILMREQARWPGWEEHPVDLDSSGEMIAREEAEWQLADRIVCGSPFVIEALRRVGGPSAKCRVVRYPVPGAPCRETRPNRPRTPLRILFAGSLQLRKGIQYVWDAARQLPAEHFSFRAVGPSHLTTDAERRIQSRIEWHGAVTTNDIWAHYGRSDVLLLPTLSEGSANVCWEAVAAGVPVLTTAAAGLMGTNAPLIRAHSDDIVGRLRQMAAGAEEQSDACITTRSIADYGADLMDVISGS
jgi:glycosyltransferase involved in cell wall biosynthesis